MTVPKPFDHAAAEDGHSWTRGWMSDSAQLLAAQGLTLVATSFAAIMVARTLEPQDWGVFSAFLGLSLALTLVTDVGISGWLLRELSALEADGVQTAEGASALVSSGIVVNAVVGAPLLGAATVWALVARPGAETTVALLSLLAYGALITTAYALEAHLRSRRKVRLVLTASLLEKAVLVVLIVAVAVAGAGIAAIGLAYLLAGGLRVAFDAGVVFLRQRLPFVAPPLASLWAVARSSLPFALNGWAFNLAPRLDTFVLLAISTTGAAWFAIGDRVLGPAFVIPGTLASALYPFMARSAAKRMSPWKLAGALGALGVVLAVIGIVLSPVLVPLVFGEAYDPAVPVVQVMLLSVPLVYATSPLLVVAYSHGRERALLAPTIAVSLLGTLAIAVGQVVGGPVLAGAGFALRFGLFLLVVGFVAHVAWRRHTANIELAIPTPGPASAPSP